MEANAYLLEDYVQGLFSNLKQKMTSEDMERIVAAYMLAKEAHQGQMRKSGEPYIIHPIAVARIVAEEFELGANPIMAAFLHDVVEDTPYTLDDIKERFGEDVAFLVGVVTKQKKSEYNQSKQIDNYRQILASVQFDVRAILIKLADRLHNMRTLESMKPDKQMKIAGETDYFYAPLANRLGMYHVKTELENLSFRFRCSREYYFLENLMEKEKAACQSRIDAFLTKIESLLKENNIRARTEIRYRMPYSIWRKMNSVECDFQHVDGKHYVRIVYEAANIKEEKYISLKIYSVFTDYFKEKPGSVSNYINAPKENGYQSFHLKLLCENGNWEEIHISSERMVRNSRLGCAAERTESNLKAWLDKFKAVLEDVAYHSEMDYMDGVTSSFYNDDIMVFTPAGRGIILPKGASAIDFAYEIHSKIGEKAVYARINGKLSSVKTELHRGDCVEIGTNEQSVPDKDWFDCVKTYKAKRYLRQFFHNQPALEYNRCNCCHPLPGDEVIGFKDDSGRITLHTRNCSAAIRMASRQGDSIVAVNFESDNRFLYPVRIQIRGVDRYHMLSDVVRCIADKLQLSIDRLHTENRDRIVECYVDFKVHSREELDNVITLISGIDGVDEAYGVNIG